MPAKGAVTQLTFRRWTGAHLSLGRRVVERDRPHLAPLGSVLALVARHVAPMFCMRHGRGLRRHGETQPVRVQQVTDIALDGDVLPQKSTDFYPKLLSGVAIYRVEGQVDR